MRGSNTSFSDYVPEEAEESESVIGRFYHRKNDLIIVTLSCQVSRINYILKIFYRVAIFPPLILSLSRFLTKIGFIAEGLEGLVAVFSFFFFNKTKKYEYSGRAK